MDKGTVRKAVLFYFSGTGNTWWVSEELVKALESGGYNAAAFSIETVNAERAVQLIESSAIVGFGYPIHGSDIPLPMKQFIAYLPRMSAKSTFVFCTQWLWSGDGAAVGAAVLKEKGFQVDWGEHFLMPNNVTVSIISLPYTNDPLQLQKILSRAQKRINAFADQIVRGNPYRRGFSPVAKFLGSMQRVPFRHYYSRLQNDIGIDQKICIDCGDCVRLCPADNLYYDGSVIKSRGSCVLCLRCYNFCPVAAITYMGRPHLIDRGEPYKGPVADFDPAVLIG